MNLYIYIYIHIYIYIYTLLYNKNYLTPTYFGIYTMKYLNEILINDIIVIYILFLDGNVGLINRL